MEVFSSGSKKSEKDQVKEQLNESSLHILYPKRLKTSSRINIQLFSVREAGTET